MSANDNTEEAAEILSSHLAVMALEEEALFGIGIPSDQGLLRTPAGHLLVSPSYCFLSHMVRELEENPLLLVKDGIIVEPRTLSAYLLSSTQRDFIADSGDIPREEVERALEHDPVLRPSPGPEWADQLRAWTPISNFLAALGATLHPRVSYRAENWENLVDRVATRWNHLSDPAKSVVVNLGALTDGNIIASLALASRECSVVEFGHAVLAATPLHYVFGFPSDELPPEEQHAAGFRHYRDLGRSCADYLNFFPNESVSLLVAEGENTSVEFKSTLRWDLRQDKKSPAITEAALKTIAAFLNTDGGILLIGVDDAGQAVGIEADGFPNDDKFLLHLTTVVKTSLGTDVAPLVQMEIDLFQGHRICVVRCGKSKDPVFVRMKGQEEAFYIRTGPSTAQLKSRELLSYVKKRFHDE